MSGKNWDLGGCEVSIYASPPPDQIPTQNEVPVTIRTDHEAKEYVMRAINGNKDEQRETEFELIVNEVELTYLRAAMKDKDRLIDTLRELVVMLKERLEAKDEN